jgi:hypothetical protein
MPAALVIGALLLALVGLLIFVRWDRKRMENSTPEPLAREALEDGSKPKEPQYWKLWFGLALVSGFLALASFVNPPRPPFTGKYSSLHVFLHESMGPNGSAYGYSAFAGVCLVAGLLRRGRKHMKH